MNEIIEVYRSTIFIIFYHKVINISTSYFHYRTIDPSSSFTNLASQITKVIEEQKRSNALHERLYKKMRNMEKDISEITQELKKENEKTAFSLCCAETIGELTLLVIFYSYAGK